MICVGRGGINIELRSNFRLELESSFTIRMSSTFKLNSGYEMPAVGFGCWKVNNDTAADQIYNAIKVGYRLFDGAQDYGNEVEVGQGIRRAIDEGLVSRQELFITSKLWNTYHEPKNAAAALE